MLAGLPSRLEKDIRDMYREKILQGSEADMKVLLLHSVEGCFLSFEPAVEQHHVP